MPLAPPVLVRNEARQALSYGLFSTFTFRGSDRWEGGTAWETDTCDPVAGIGDWECPPGSTVGLPKVLDPNAGAVGEASPFTVYGHFTCAPVGYSPSDAQERATTHLLAREEQRVEQAFCTGDLGNTPYLTDPAETTVLAGGTAVSLSAALAVLEDFIGGHHGSLGVIHLTRGAALLAAASRLLVVAGGRLTTVLGTPVAAGAGYPDGWAYASPAVFGYRSDPFTSSARPGDLLDRGHNSLTAIAERTYLLGFDPCGVGAVKIAAP